jgi:hypothetical protein
VSDEDGRGQRRDWRRHLRALGDWLADLLRHGLLRPSFILPAPVRALRDLLRYRTSLVQAEIKQHLVPFAEALAPPLP